MLAVEPLQMVNGQALAAFANEVFDQLRLGILFAIDARERLQILESAHFERIVEDKIEGQALGCFDFK